VAQSITRKISGTPPSAEGPLTERDLSCKKTDWSVYNQPVPRISQVRKDEQRQRFVEAAWRCAARKGYRDITVDDVCAEAGLSKGAFYGYFDHKRSLLLAMLEQDSLAMDALMDSLSRAEPSSARRVRRFTQAILERAADPAQVQVRADLWTIMSAEPAVRDRFVEAVEGRRGVLRGWIEEGVRSGELVEIPANAFASLLLALGDGLLLHRGLQPTAFRWSNIRKAIDVLLAGITRP